MKAWKALVGLLGVFGGFLITTLYVWFPAWVTMPFFRGAGHWHSSAIKGAEADWLTHSFWLWFAIWSIICAGLAAWYLVDTTATSTSSRNSNNRTDRYNYRYKPYLGMVAMTVLSFVLLIALSINGIFYISGTKDKARHYSEETYFAVDELDALPASLQRLVEGSEGVVPGFDGPFGESDAIIGSHDIPSVVIQASLPKAGWQVRNNSYQSAVRQMQRTSGNEPGSQLLTDTVTYLPGETTESGVWTGIRDGRGKQNHIKGIIEWSGNTELAVTACEFKGEYKLDQALMGSRGNSLNHALFAEVPAGWWYNIEDVYGFCTPDGEPVLVIPMLQYERFGGRTVATTADVVLVHGSPSGDPRFERLNVVEPGTIPGPVYPISLSRSQREQADWAAGRKWHDNESFGYEPSNADTQSGNGADYLLKSEEDGRLYWVTPLTLGKSDSQLTIAYSVIPADSAQRGELNDLVVYVLADNDPRVTDFARSESNVKTAISRFDSGFFGTPGNRLEEFIPGASGQWTAFAVDANGIPKYFVDIVGGEQGVITVRDGESSRVVNRLDLTVQVTPEGEAACSADIQSLSDTALLACLDAIGVELQQRLEKGE